MNADQRATPSRLIPVSKWSEFHAWPPAGGLRHLIFHSRTNGFESAIRRIGRRVLIDEHAFFEWVHQVGVRQASRKRPASRREG